MDKLLNVYKNSFPGLDNLTTDDLLCDGCLSKRKSKFGGPCPIKDCVGKMELEGCHKCDDFPCPNFEATIFQMPVGKKVVLRTVPYRRKYGTEKFIHDEEARYICPECGHKLFRGAKRCNKCKTLVDLD